MNVINFLLPQPKELEAISTCPHVRAIYEECCRGEGRNQYRYYRFGHVILQNLPLSFRWIASYLLSCASKRFEAFYTYNSGRHFTEWAQNHHLRVLSRTTRHIPTPSNSDRRFLLMKNCCLKGHKDHPSARGFMEQFVWECAKILEVEDFFVPTARMTQGCIQPRIRGQVLNSGEVFSLQELVMPMMIIVVFGLADAYADNIVVDADCQIHFVDNVRCFPHSNDFVKVYDNLLPAIRCGLLEFDVCYKPLSFADKMLLIKVFNYFQERLPLLEQHIREVDAAKLPPKWFETEQIIKALHQRMERLFTALENDRIDCLRDIVFAAHPYYRFAAALALFQDGNKVLSPQNAILGGFFGAGFDLNELIFNNMYIDVAQLWETCCNLTISFDKILTTTRQKPVIENLNKLERVLEELKRIAADDYKDFRAAIPAGAPRNANTLLNSF